MSLSELAGGLHRARRVRVLGYPVAAAETQGGKTVRGGGWVSGASKWPNKSPAASEGLDSIAGRRWIDFGTVVECCCGNLEKGDVVDRGGGGSSGGSWRRQFRQPLACQKEQQGLHRVADAEKTTSRGVASGSTAGV